ncbi:MAG: DUF4279 domain-containing protein [Pyrinomonadaceae bacterium]|nr:DUF4279 domain-containing protein [Pyrinomonadaceae bacterium]
MASKGSKRSSATLRIHSQKIGIDEITDALKLQPSKTLMMGSKVDPNHPKSYVRPSNLWSLDSGLRPSRPLEEHIAKLVEVIEEKITVLMSMRKSCDMDIFCGFSSMHGQGSFALSHELLKRLTVLPIKIIVDLYPPESTA